MRRNLEEDLRYSINFTNLTFSRLFPYIYRENSKFLRREEAFRKFTIEEEIGKKEMRKRGKMSFC